MKIYAKEKFIDGRDIFEAGKRYDIDDTRGMYFISLGWASYAGKTSLWRRIVRRKNG